MEFEWKKHADALARRCEVFNGVRDMDDLLSYPYMREAEERSMNALKRFKGAASLSDFLTAHNVHTVVLASTTSWQKFAFDEEDTRLNWGVDAMLLNMTNRPEMRLDYLQTVANFSGEVRLLGIGLTKSEAPLFLEKLGCSQTPPHSLHVHGSFYGFGQQRKNVGWDLLETVRTNGKIKALTVSFSNLDFVDIPAPIASLRSLALIGIRIGDNFYKQMSAHLAKWTSLISLTFSVIYVSPHQMWREVFSSFVQEGCSPLKHLALEGFSINQATNQLLDFIKLLQKNSHLQSLSLAKCSTLSFSQRDLASAANSIVDAIHKSKLLYLDLKGTSFTEYGSLIEAQLQKNQAKHHQVLETEYEKVPATTVRLFICGDAYAGKTTLLKTLCKKRSWLKLSHGASSSTNQRTRGIEVRNLVRGGIRVSAWDMAGQEEYHALHDHIFPDMSAHGIPALFLFVWSPIDSEDHGRGECKSAESFEASLCYWLKFIASKTRPSNEARKVIVVLTRKDQTKFVQARISRSLSKLKDTFQVVIEIAGVWEVDARNHTSVEVVASSIFECAKSVLKDVKVYRVCDEVSTHLASMGLLILAWEDFQKLCKDRFNVIEAEHQIAIALSLHESGHLIYFRKMPFLILDTNWFCCKVMGELIYFSGLSVGSAPVSGFVPQEYVEKLLEHNDLSSVNVKASHLVDLMEAMHLCCKETGNAHSDVFIPSMLPNHGRRATTLCWRASVNNERAKFFHAGRRLECRDKVLTFLTPGVFLVIQVAFKKAFFKIGADVLLHKFLISICYQWMEIIVEFCKANGENVIDILVRSSEKMDPTLTLKVMEEKISRAIIRMCAEPVGNQGVQLVQGLLRPECLIAPAPSHEREDQYVLIQHLKEDLKRQLQEHPQQATFCHTWKHNQYFEVGADSIMELLGLEEYWDVVKSYKFILQEVAKEIKTACGHEYTFLEDKQDASDMVMQQMAAVSTADGKHKIEMNREGLQEEEGVDAICQGMATSILRGIRRLNSKVNTIDRKLDSVRSNLEAMHGEIQSLARLQGKILPQIQRAVKQLLVFGTEQVVGRVPRLGILTTEGLGFRRRFVTALSQDVKSFRIELFCERKECPHKVEGQNGICITTINDGLLKKALPYANGILKVLTMVARVGAHVVAGAGYSIPDFTKIVTLLLDTPGLLDSFDNALGSMDITSTFNGWQQWLVHVLEENGGMTEHNIFNKFKLRRALYKQTSQVAWLCELHYNSQTPFPLS